MTDELCLYSRKDCDLCDEMQDALWSALNGTNVTYRVVDVDQDPELQHRYGARIPVLVADGEEICEVVLNETALNRFLRQRAALR